ncbi:hypothetical protein [Cytobacillus oceanisediminis]|uniref:hypothetical protein n=1 Tax=Cytobacillus oceanisediminis TaxID=665099 RepID=UPI001FB3D8A4|nr:hypothetical protein [Cytobacillus oceanisediminis]UOE53518.1 hypothetical protein IRB79_16745 [Cytobacillus oceanisediminis]
MPRVNKVRLSNIRLDDKNKIITDKTFHLYGGSSLFLLENGGGKSSIIQFIHQLILPNHQMGERSMKEMVPVGQTIHIAAEWVHDDEQRFPFVTGFCFENTGKKTADSKDEYQYFNYIIEYEFEGAYRIEDLPFIIDRKVANYNVLREKLKKSKGVNLPPTNTRYQEELESYNILSTEWKNISLVNSSEGGVTDFFGKVNTTQRLLEKLIIPSVLESLYPDEKERYSFKESFREYKDSLMELPKMRKNLQDYGVINNNAGGIIQVCKDYNALKQSLIESQTLLSRLYFTLLESSQANALELEGIVSELIRLADTKEELDWKIRSYDVFLLEKKYKEAKEKAALDEETFIKTVANLESEKRREKEQLAARSYQDYQTNQTKLAKKTSELEAARLEGGERQKELGNIRNTLSRQFYYLYQQNQKAERDLKEEQYRIKREREKVQDILTETNQEMEKLGKRQVVLQHQVETYDKDLIGLKQGLIEDWKEDEQTTHHHLKEKLSAVVKEEEFYKAQAEQCRNRINDLDQLLEQCNTKEKLTRKDLDEAEAAYDKFSERERLLIDSTYKYVTVRVGNSLFEDRDLIAIRLDRLKSQYDDEATQLSIQMDEIGQIRAIIENKGYHIHQELERVKDYLVQRDIEVLLGVEWITKSTMDDTSKKELLKKNPLLPFSILVEDVQLTKVKTTLGHYKEELTIPVILINKSQMEMEPEKDATFQLSESAHIFHHFNTRLKAEDWESYLVELEQKWDDLDLKRKEIKGKLQELQLFEHTLKDFWKEYTPHSRKDLLGRVTELRDTLRKIGEEKTEYNKEKEAQSTSYSEAESQRNEKEQLRIKLTGETIRLSDFIKRYQSIPAARKELEQLTKQLEELGGIKNALNQTSQEWESAGGAVQEKITQLQKSFILLKRDLEDYEIAEAEETTPATEVEYKDTLERYKAFREQYSSESRQLEILESTQNHYSELVKRAKEDIQKNGFTVESMERLMLEYDPYLLEQIEYNISELDDQLEKDRSLKEGSGKDLAIAETEYRTRAELLGEKGIYPYGTDAKAEKELYESELAVAESNEGRSMARQSALLKEQSGNRTAIEDLETTKDMLIASASQNLLEEEHWNREKPIQDVRTIRDDMGVHKSGMELKRTELLKKIDELKEDVRETNNTQLLQLTFDLSKILDSSIEDYQEIIRTFENLMNYVQELEAGIELQKAELDQRSGELVEQMYDRAVTVYKNIMEIAKSSQIEEKGEITSLFQISWHKKSIEDAKMEIDRFIQRLLEDFVAMNERNAPVKEMDELFEKRVNMVDILNCYAETSRCIIKTLKHRNELLNKNDYYTWDEVCKWSGGEKHATQISLFIALINHLRKKRYAKENAWKFIILDNPFGKASADFVVKPMVSLANKTNTQLFCFTGIKEKAIQREFETVISNQYVEQRGRLLLSTEEKHKDPSMAELDTIFFVKSY